MKTIEIQSNLNRAEKAILDYLNLREKFHNKALENLGEEYHNEDKNDLMDHSGYIKKEFIKLRKETKDLIIIDEPINTEL